MPELTKDERDALFAADELSGDGLAALYTLENGAHVLAHVVDGAAVTPCANAHGCVVGERKCFAAAAFRRFD